MKFSIIVPVYNAEKYLKKCVQSIRKQEFQNYEAILVDDGSTDSSGKICDCAAYKYDNFRVIHQKNLGLSAARNTGIKNAAGDYLLFLDSDDFLINQYSLNAVSDSLTDNEDMAVFESRRYRDGRLMEKIFDLSGIICEPCSGKDYLMTVLTGKKQYLWMCWQYAYRRKWWEENDFVFQEGIRFEDVELTFKCLLKAEKMKVLDIPVYAYRSCDGSITKSAGRALLQDFLYVIEKNIHYVNGMQTDPVLKKELNNNFSSSYITILMMAETINDKRERENIYRMIKKKKWICDYSVHGKHVIPAKVIKAAGVDAAAWLIGVRRKVRKLLKADR